nr:hypothetical protein GCM10020093_013560 [Planobispora longispora]
MDEEDWRRLVDQLHKGECTPFLGAGASLTLPTGTTLSKIFAARYGYPFTDDHNLARVMQYTESVVRDPVYLKGKVCDELQSYRRPSPHDPANPHALLAKFPLQTFLTTNYDDFLVEALNAMGKQPHSAISPGRWTRPAARNRAPPPPTGTGTRPTRSVSRSPPRTGPSSITCTAPGTSPPHWC